MNSAKINFLNLRASFLIILTAMLVSFLLQINFPTLQEMRNNLTSVWVERQMDLTGGKGSTLVQDGWTYFQLGQLAKAKALMEKAFAEDNSISALYCLGLIDLKYRRFDDSIVKLEKVSAFSPNHVPTMMALGESYFQLGYFGRSKELFEKAVKHEPTSTKARLWLGRTYINLNETIKARQVLNTVNSGPEAQEAAALIKNI